MERHIINSERALTFSRSCIARELMKLFGKARKTIIVHRLNKKDMEKRLEFAKYIQREHIQGSQILFTDESRFSIACKPNRQITQVRLTKKAKKDIIEGTESEEVHKASHFHSVQHPLDLMVAGGVSKYGLTELIFIIGNMNKFAYKQALELYKADLTSFPLSNSPTLINNPENFTLNKMVLSAILQKKALIKYQNLV